MYGILVSPVEHTFTLEMRVLTLRGATILFFVKDCQRDKVMQNSERDYKIRRSRNSWRMDPGQWKRVSCKVLRRPVDEHKSLSHFSFCFWGKLIFWNMWILVYVRTHVVCLILLISAIASDFLALSSPRTVVNSTSVAHFVKSVRYNSLNRFLLRETMTPSLMHARSDRWLMLIDLFWMSLSLWSTVPLHRHKPHFILQTLWKNHHSQCVHGNLSLFHTIAPGSDPLQWQKTCSLRVNTLDVIRIFSVPFTLFLDDIPFVPHDVRTSSTWISILSIRRSRVCAFPYFLRDKISRIWDWISCSSHVVSLTFSVLHFRTSCGSPRYSADWSSHPRWTPEEKPSCLPCSPYFLGVEYLPPVVLPICSVTAANLESLVATQSSLNTLSLVPSYHPCLASLTPFEICSRATRAKKRNCRTEKHEWFHEREKSSVVNNNKTAQGADAKKNCAKIGASTYWTQITQTDFL